MPLPPELLQAIAAPEGGRVVLILGAGCSFEPPTSIPLAKACSVEAHRRLMLDGILSDGECGDPEDLSTLADTVKAKTGLQAEVVSRLPISAFRNATPNEGHLVAAAMLIEGVLTNVLTLNFDLALSHALSQLGARDLVVVIKGPEDHQTLGRANVIYLHRNVEVDSEQWVLTSDALENAWKSAWEEVITRMATTAPFVIFAGMGSSCGVLTKSIERLRKAVGDRANVFLADPGDREWSRFAKELSLKSEECIQVGWVDFMRELSQRLASEYGARISTACTVMVGREHWPTENIQGLCDRLTRLGIVGVGKLRASWLLGDQIYCRHEDGHDDLLADVLLAIGLIERTANVTIHIRADRIVEVAAPDNARASFLVASGKGTLRWASIEAQILHCEKYCPRDTGDSRPRRALVSGVIGTPLGAVTPPASIVDLQDSDSILTDQASLQLWSTDELRANPAAVIRELFA